MKIEKGEFYITKRGTIVRVIDEYGNVYNHHIKLRCIRPCMGRYSSKKRIGKPYTYSYTTLKDLFMKEKPRRIGTEELLLLLFIKVRHLK